MNRVLLICVVSALATSSSCRLFGVDISCEEDRHCPGGLVCVEGVCGTNGGDADINDDVAAGALQCTDDSDCGGDPCDNGACAATTWLAHDDALSSLALHNDALVFSTATPGGFFETQCDGFGFTTDLASRALSESAGTTFKVLTTDCAVRGVEAGATLAWVGSEADDDGNAYDVLRTSNDGSAPIEIASPIVPPEAFNFAVSGARVLWIDSGNPFTVTVRDATLHAHDSTVSLALEPVAANGFEAVLVATENELLIGEEGKLTVLASDPALWESTRRVYEVPGRPGIVVGGTTRLFFRSAAGISWIARDSGVVHTLNATAPATAFATVGDTLYAIEDMFVRAYPADGSGPIELATNANASYELVVADGWLWWIDGNTIRRVRIVN